MEKIVRFQHEGDSGAFLTNPKNLTPKELEASKPFTMLEAETANGLRELADYLDQSAEDVNAHDFVGCHRLLAQVLVNHAGIVGAGQVMYEIAEHGGLHGMNGICSDKSAFKALGIAEPWKDWALKV